MSICSLPTLSLGKCSTQNLGLAGNPIAGVRQLVVLRSLPSLMELNLDDIHFGTCPVVKAEGYRDFVMCVLRQVTLSLLLVGY